MSTKYRTPTTREGIEARITESRAFLNQISVAHSRVEREFLRHAARRATITKAEQAAGQPLDQARRDEWGQTMKALEKTPVVTLGDVAAVLDMLRREAREHKPTTRRDRLRARLLNSASETVKALRDAVAYCHPFNEPSAYAIHPRAARLMAAEVARVMEARDGAENEKVKANSAEFAALLGQIGEEGQEYVVTLLALQNVSTLSGRALARFVHDEDRDFIARGIRRQLAAVTKAITEAPSPTPHITSTIPALGMTFREAADRVRELLDWNEASANRNENDDSEEGRQRAANVAEWGRIQDAMFSPPAATFGDVLAKLERMACPEIGAGTFSIRPEELHAIAADVARLGAGGLNTNTTADSEILAALRRWIEASKRCDDLRSTPDDDPEFEAAVAAHSDAARALARTPARSALGLAAKLYILWQCERGDTPAGPASIVLPTPDMSDDTEDGTLILGLIGDALRMFPALHALATGDTSAALASLSTAPALDAAATSPAVAQPDTFADTVAAFESEAPGMLSVPQIPTQAMEQAATQVAGITPEQFRYAYAAALEAFKQERAA